MALALLTYNPKDAAFNVSAPPPDGGAAKNWIGPVGAYGADLFFQIFGFAAFLVPAAVRVLGWSWVRSLAIASPLSSCAHFPAVFHSRHPRSHTRRWLCGSTGFQRIAGEPESGRISSRSGLAGSCDFHDDSIFFCGCARLGQRTEWADWKSGKARYSAEGPGALAYLARRARAAPHAPSCGRVPPLGKKTRCAAINWKSRSIE